MVGSCLQAFKNSSIVTSPLLFPHSFWNLFIPPVLQSAVVLDSHGAIPQVWSQPKVVHIKEPLNTQEQYVNLRLIITGGYHLIVGSCLQAFKNSSIVTSPLQFPHSFWNFYLQIVFQNLQQKWLWQTSLVILEIWNQHFRLNSLKAQQLG